MTVVLLILAVYRVTRFVTADTLTEPLRARVERRFGEDSKLAYLVECPWCVSPYVGALIVGATVAVDAHTGWTIDVPVPVLLWLAASAVTGLIAANLDPG